MGRRDDARQEPVDAHGEKPGEATNHLQWTRELWSSVRCAGVLFVLLLLVDWGSGRLAVWRAALWLALAGLLFVALYPARVSAGEGWLSSRRMLRERRVRTDLLVSVRCLDGVSQRLVLRDAFGGRIEIASDVLVINPRLWHRLDADARKWPHRPRDRPRRVQGVRPGVTGPAHPWLTGPAASRAAPVWSAGVTATRRLRSGGTGPGPGVSMKRPR
ncbi:hypothetical protein EDD92_1046 [Streptomyces sp. TLI_185]|nr:hypothetical protein EDD92_1046 [Streptomyces sp. TLI_185]